jgi:hypothetical protein
MVDRPPQPAEDDDNAKVNQRRRLAWRLAGAGLPALGLLVVLLLACVLWIPRWLYPSLTDTDLQNVSDAAKVQELKDARLKLQNDARTTLLQGLGALLVLTGAGIGASVTLRQVRATRDQITETATASRNQLRLSEQGQVTERFTRAIDQLGHAQLDVRLGGIYALERIARDSPADRATIGEVLTAFIRSHAPWPPRLPGQYTQTASIDEVPELQVRAADVQACLTVLGRGGFALSAVVPGREVFGLPGVAEVRLDPQVVLLGLGREVFTVPGVAEGRLDLHAVDLRRAGLRGAHLEEAYLAGARLEAAYLGGAHLEAAILVGAHLEGVTLVLADLEGAHLEGAHLEGATLAGAHLERALADEHTVWPKDFDWRAAGIIRFRGGHRS